MNFLNTLNIAGSALTAQRLRIDTITQNIANANTTRTENGRPYARKLIVMNENPLDFKQELDKKITSQGGGVYVSEVINSEEPFKLVYDPSHPHANAQGYVEMPNVNTAKEQVDLLAATRAYEANITSLNVAKQMIMRSLEIGK